MKSLRELIETIESKIVEAPGDVVAGAPETGALETLPSSEGKPDIEALSRMLPDVTDAATFAAAIQKVRLGRLERLTRWEKEQLSNAFISLFRGDPNSSNTAMQKLRALRAK